MGVSTPYRGDLDVLLIKTDAFGNADEPTYSVINATISFYIGDPNTDGVPIGQDNITVLGNASATASIEWKPIIGGVHNIYVRVEDVEPCDTNLTNNIANKTIDVSLSENPPHLKANIPNTFSFSEDTIATHLINLSHYFEDTNIPQSHLSYSISSLSNEPNIYGTIEDHFISFSSEPNWTGYEPFQVNCTNDFSLWAKSNVFNVTVTPINDLPITNLNFPENDSIHNNQEIALKWSGKDPDGPIENILYYIYISTDLDKVLNQNDTISTTVS